MMANTVEVGDRFIDRDPRSKGERVIKVLRIVPPYTAGMGARARVEVIAAPEWTPKALGRISYINLKRLEAESLFEKVSR